QRRARQKLAVGDPTFSLDNLAVEPSCGPAAKARGTEAKERREYRRESDFFDRPSFDRVLRHPRLTRMIIPLPVRYPGHIRPQQHQGVGSGSAMLTGCSRMAVFRDRGSWKIASSS